MAKFKAGCESPNPNGRPKNSGARQKIFKALVEPSKNEIVNTAITMALSGNEAMLKIFLERLLPAKPKEEPLFLDLQNHPLTDANSLHQLAIKLIGDVASGNLTPEEGQKFSSLIEDHYKIIQLSEISTRITKLEKKSNLKAKTNEKIEND